MASSSSTTLRSIAPAVFGSIEDTIQYLMTNGLLASSRTCPRCDIDLLQVTPLIFQLCCCNEYVEKEDFK